MNPNYIRWFDDVRRADVTLAGGKGASLGELVRAGFPVPAGFVVTTEAYRSYLAEANIADELRVLFAALDPHDEAALARTASYARDLVRTAQITPSCRKDVEEAYDHLGAAGVAVRSSATAEDTAEASFAGQQSTFLNVVGGGPVIDATRGCWASLFETRAVQYRARRGVDHVSCDMAVVVQRMVPAARSGVAFGCDPVSGDTGRILIEAVRGLGEALVSGAVTPDMYVIDKTTLTVLDRAVEDQAREYVYGGGASRSGETETNVWRAVPDDVRAQPKLGDDEIAKIAALVRRVEEHYGAPQDVEWAEAGGSFYVLQARPITTLG